LDLKRVTYYFPITFSTQAEHTSKNTNEDSPLEGTMNPFNMHVSLLPH